MKWRAIRETVAHSLRFGALTITRGTPVWTATDSTLGEWMNFRLRDDAEFTLEMSKFTNDFERDGSPGLD
jgi:hypothetical protein